MIMKRLEKAKVLLEDGYKIVNLEIEDGSLLKLKNVKMLKMKSKTNSFFQDFLIFIHMELMEKILQQ